MSSGWQGFCKCWRLCFVSDSGEWEHYQFNPPLERTSDHEIQIIEHVPPVSGAIPANVEFWYPNYLRGKRNEGVRAL